ncbi:MAG: endonuclease/exonuclease/phosphatase family protein [Spirochaetes bacterium]|nr:endonuclease/exonuclease/phosphatase family protein [Spirochaetota bacterium]
MKKSDPLPRILFATLFLFFSLHILRLFISASIWNFGYYLGSPVNIALYSLSLFACVFLAPPLRRIASERAMLTIVTCGIAAVRVLAQFIREPLVLIGLSSLGVVMLLWFLALWNQALLNRRSPDDVPVLAAAIPAAFMLDTAVRTALLSYDILWRRTAVSAVAVIILSLLLLWLLYRLQDRTRGPSEESTTARSVLFAALGPWFFIVFALFQNPAAMAESAGIGEIPSAILTNGSMILGGIVCLLAASSRGLRRSFSTAGGLLLALCLYLFVSRSGPVWLWIVVASVSSWGLLGYILSASSRSGATRRGLWGGSLSVFLLFLVFLVFVFLNAQFKLQWVVLPAGMLVALAAAAAAWSYPGVKAAPRSPSLATTVAAAVVAAAITFLWALTVDYPGASAPRRHTGPIRVMAYNIHQSFDADIRVDLEGIAAAIGAQDPDILCLQEVNRAQIQNGMIDCLPYLAMRLGMPWVFRGYHEDGQYGNAILTRLPIEDRGWYSYKANRYETRGVTWATVTTASGPVTVYSVHLDHSAGEKNVRAAQMEELLSLWAGRPRSILLGDFNAKHDSREIEVMRGTPLLDVLKLHGIGSRPTFREGYGDPAMHIDYIFSTPDLRWQWASIVESRASDHKPVVAGLLMR